MSTGHDHGPLRNLEALTARVEAHARRVELSHAEHFACRRGCSNCCQTERTVTDVEFAALVAAFERQSQATRSALAERTSTTPCPLLLDDACALYDSRPLICRTHGLPLVMEGQPDVCPLNFTEYSILSLPDRDLLSVDTLTAILVAVNALYCEETGGDPRRRRAMSELFELDPESSKKV